MDGVLILYTLCLSGGGFRATLFHLGVIRRLIFLDVFKRVNRINSVSGGSILAGVVMKELSLNGDFKSVKDFDIRITIPMIDFIQSSPKKQLFKMIPLQRSPQRFVKVLDKSFFNNMSFMDLTDKVNWCCYATSLDSTMAWKYSKQGVGDESIGYFKASKGDSISIGVTASACFIPLFRPMEISIGSPTTKIFLVDGGIYDNLGVDSVLNSMTRDNNQVIVSDASAIIERWESKNPSRFMKLNRTIDISMDQNKKLRRRIIQDKILNTNRGVLIEVTKPVKTYVKKEQLAKLSVQLRRVVPHYQEVDNEIQKNLGEIRTDLNAFHDLEIQLLIWNGMIKIDASIKLWKSGLISKEHWTDVPKLRLGEYEREEVLKILKKGDDMKVFESHKELHHGKPLKDSLDMIF